MDVSQQAKEWELRLAMLEASVSMIAKCIGGNYAVRIRLAAEAAAATFEAEQAKADRPSSSREEVLRQVKQRIDACIKDVPLPGDGLDKSAERNGLILASIIVAQMLEGQS